jgi:hypothetical protein
MAACNLRKAFGSVEQISSESDGRDMDDEMKFNARNRMDWK